MNNFLLNLLEISVFSSVIIVIISFIGRLTQKRYSVKWRYFIWIILAVRMLIPVTPHMIKIPVINDSMPQQKEMEWNESVTKVHKFNDNKMLQKTSKTESFRNEDKNMKPISFDLSDYIKLKGYISYSTIFFIIWIIGMAAFLFYHMAAYISFRRSIKRWSTPVSNPRFLEIMKEEITKLGLFGNVSILLCGKVSSPMLMGFFHSIIILPGENFNENQMKIMIRHELVHLRQHDIFYKLLLLMANAFQWYNPFVYYMTEKANQDIEIMCDEKVLQGQDKKFRQLYSMTLLEIITNNRKGKNLALSTFFRGKSNQLKRRFYQIMNQNKTKKGWVIFSILVCSILLLGNLTVYGKGSNPIKLNLMNGEGNPIQKQESTLKALSHILLIGLDGEGGGKDKRADSILLITLDFKRKEIIATSILRDLLVTIPGYGEDKVSAVYTYGTSKLLKETLQNELSIQIDGIMTVEYQGFINIIDELGGIEGKLTKEEAEYLQRTNYIKNPINRNIKEGVQLLNGDQALGYIRVRHVQTSDHESDDFGRTARQRDILHSIFTKSKGLTIDKMLKIMDNIQSHFKTDMNHDIMIEYLSKIMKDMHLWNFSEVTLPAKDTYKTEQRNGRFVLIPDWEANKKMLN